jgi:hypothetical protein
MAIVVRASAVRRCMRFSIFFLKVHLDLVITVCKKFVIKKTLLVGLDRPTVFH